MEVAIYFGTTSYEETARSDISKEIKDRGKKLLDGRTTVIVITYNQADNLFTSYEH